MPSRNSAAFIRWTAATPTNCTWRKSRRGACRSSCCIRPRGPRTANRRLPMQKTMTIVAVAAIALGVSIFAQPAAEIGYDANADFLTLPANTYLGEVAGVATNSKGHLFVYTRTGHAVATL